METLKIEALTKEAFKPFGDVIETENSDFFFINDKTGKRFHQLTDVAVTDETSPFVSIIRAEGFKEKLTFSLLEKHPLGSQAFYPLKGEQFIVIVAEGEDEIDESTLRVFVTNGKQGVNYHKNVWHYLLFAWNEDTDFITVDRAGDDNCIVNHLSKEYTVLL
ncbi:ureidoglycolate lyase [Photobacterium sanctipauli]|uniref:Ureidoglycolate lyase n=2 Tax=Photobacterium sanctipauli TaxID=1342794 RepID=A0A2T3NU58_9GAMM|nr:ureidoglycolate lyase [Photobacterium sanctipauli]PSW19826.1 ureidoglycolate lyase [Photobacterium sanctipauli]